MRGATSSKLIVRYETTPGLNWAWFWLQQMDRDMWQRDKMTRLGVALGAALLILSALTLSGARAQAPPSPLPVSTVCGYKSLSASNASSRTALPTTNPPCGAVVVFNSGSVDASIKLGGSSVTAATTDLKVKAGTGFSLWVGASTNVAAITASGSTTLDIWQATGPINLAGGGSTSLAASAAGGATTSSTIIPNNTTAVVVKASPGQIYGVECWNNNTTIAYIKVYDAISATAGSGTPAARYMCPASSSGSGFVRLDTIGRQYLTGITYIVTTGIADNDTTAPAANTYIVNIGYK